MTLSIMLPMAQPETTLPIRVTPSAGRDEIAGLLQGVLHIRVKAPPREGKAKEAATALLAQALGLAKRRVSVVRGHTSRYKMVAIRGLSREEVARHLGLDPGP